MITVQESPWGGQPLDPLPLERATDAAWFAQRTYERELGQSADEDGAREVALNRLRWRHAAELLAAEAAIDALRGFPNE